MPLAPRVLLFVALMVKVFPVAFWMSTAELAPKKIARAILSLLSAFTVRSKLFMLTIMGFAFVYSVKLG